MDKTMSQGRDIVHLRGTRKSVWRTVYLQGNGKYLIEYYGQELEVVKATIGYITVDYIDC